MYNAIERRSCAGTKVGVEGLRETDDAEQEADRDKGGLHRVARNNGDVWFGWQDYANRRYSLGTRGSIQ